MYLEILLHFKLTVRLTVCLAYDLSGRLYLVSALFSLVTSVFASTSSVFTSVSTVFSFIGTVFITCLGFVTLSGQQLPTTADGKKKLTIDNLTLS